MKLKSPRYRLLAVLAVPFLLGFQQDVNTRDTHEKLHGVSWVQTSPEYKMTLCQTFKLVEKTIELALADKTWTAAVEQQNEYAQLPPAVIFDLDETLLDNSPFQARMVKKNKDFIYNDWKAWVNEASAAATPCSLGVIKALSSNSIEVFYVTNRSHDFADQTAKNLERLSFPLKPNAANLLSKGKEPSWTSDKATRRKFVAQSHRVLFLIGDDLNDFVSGVKGEGVTVQMRNDIAERYNTNWASKWFLVPNPLYGSWEKALYGFKRDLADDEVLILKRQKLVPF